MSGETGTFTIEIDSGIVVLTFSGEQTAESFMVAMDAIVAHPDYSPGMGTLWDLREALLHLNNTDAASRLAQHGARLDKIRGFHRTAAVVARDVEFGVGRMYQMVAERPTHEMQIFRDSDEAVAWLKEDRTSTEA